MFRGSRKVLPEFSPQNLSNSLWAVANLKIWDKQFFEGVYDESLRKISEFTGEHVMQLREAFQISQCRENLSGATDSISKFPSFRSIDRLAEDLFKDIQEYFATFPFWDDHQKTGYLIQMKAFQTNYLAHSYVKRLLESYGVCVVGDDDNTTNVDGFIDMTNDDKLINRVTAVCDFSLCCKARDHGKESVMEKRGLHKLISGEALPGAPGIRAAVMGHPRGGDAEFQVLTEAAKICIKLCQEAGHTTSQSSNQDSAILEASNCYGKVRMSVSEVPCLSCCGAMIQFRKRFPNVRLQVRYDFGHLVQGKWI